MVFIGIIGPGLVGKEVIKQISGYQVASNGTLRPAIDVLGICSSKLSLVAANASEPLKLSEWENRWSQPSNPQSDVLSTFVQQLKDLLGPTELSCLVLIDCSASEAIASKYPEWLKAGISVVTPNKKAFSSDMQLWDDIQAAVKPNSPTYALCFHESSVGAGLPVISTLKDLVLTGDSIEKIEGILSGTLSYLFNRYCHPSSKDQFADIVSEAKNLGYTEPDPRDDLNGIDVARKVTILGRVAGLRISMEDLEVENIVPVPLQQVATAEEFMQRLPQFNQDFEKLKQQAAADGKVLRYVGIVNKSGKSQVKLATYSSSHPFAQLQGSDNVIAIHTKRFAASPLIIQGAGAGAAVTAHGVVSDLIKVSTVLDYGK